MLATYEEQHRVVQREVERSRRLQSIKRRRKDGRAVFISFASDVEKKGLPITKAGPDLVKKYAYVAAVYHDQQVHGSEHRVQALCYCATHLLHWVEVTPPGHLYQG